MRVTAVATRTGRWWAVEVPELPGLFTQARRLDQVAAVVTDAARLLTDVAVEVTVRPVLPDDIQSAVERLRAEAAEADKAQQRAAEDVRALVSSLRAKGFSVRDVGTVLGVSPQRVSQLSAGRVSA